MIGTHCGSILALIDCNSVLMSVACFVQVQHTRMMGACIDLGMPSVNFMRMCQEATSQLRREEVFGHLQALSL